MFKRDKKLDVDGLNDIISISKKILRIGFAFSIVAIIILVLYMLKMLNIFGILKQILIVISPVFIGLVIAWLFDPLVSYLTDKKIPRVLSCILVYAIFLGLLSLIVSLIVPAFVNQIKDVLSSIPSMIVDFKKFISNIINSFSNNYGIDLAPYKSQVFSNLEAISNNLTTSLPDKLIGIFKGIFSGGMFLILGLMIGFYMLYDFNKIHQGIINILPDSWEKNANELSTRINSSLRGYVSGVLLVMLLVFLTQSIALNLVGLKAPLVFALFCAVTDIIPYFGPYIGAIPAVIVGFTISPLTGIFCVIAIVIVQLLENNFYQPLIMGHTMRLHPVTIILGLLVFQHFFGIVGMIVATPVIATFKIIFEFVDEKIKFMSKITGKDKEIEVES